MKLLVAEDSKTSRYMLVEVSKKWGYEVVEAKDGGVAWDALQEDDAPDLLLLDWEMPKIDGVELCKRIREKETNNPPYIVLLTARTAIDDIIEGLEAGANDYISKPFNMKELRARLAAGSRVLELQMERNNALDILTYQANYDVLTNIMNRRAVLEGIEKEVNRAQREHTALCIGMCDIDHFKAINDEHGHLVGDDVLKEVVARMKHILRPYDLIGRYGGEEFVIATIITGKDVEKLFSRICKSVSDKPIVIDKLKLTVTISCGVTELNKDVNTDDPIRSLISVADSALYEAKNSGRNKVVFA